MGESQQLPFTITVKDDGSVVLNDFEKGLGDTAKKSTRAGGVMTRAFRRVTGTLGGVLRSLTSVRGLLIGLGIGVAIRSLIRVGDTIENARTRLIGLRGGIEGANKAFDFFQGVASRVAFSLDEVIKAGVTLEAFGAKSEETLEAVVDLAAFMGESVPFAAASFGRAFAGGAGAADILRERGILTLVRLRTGLTDLSKLTLPEFRKVLLESLRDPTGPIAKSAERLAVTFRGVFSFLGDAFFKLQQRIIEAGLGDLIKDIARSVTVAFGALQNEVKDSDDSLRNFFGTLRAGVPAAATIGKTILLLTEAFLRARIVVLSFQFGLGALRVGFTIIFALMVKFTSFLNVTLVRAFESAGRGIVSFVTAALDFASQALVKLGSALKASGVDRVKQMGQSMFTLAGTLAGTAKSIEGLTGNFDGLADTVEDNARVQINELITAIQRLEADTNKTDKQITNATADLRRLGDTILEFDQRVKQSSKTRLQDANNATNAIVQAAQKQRDEIARILLELSGENRIRLLTDTEFQRANLTQQLNLVRKALKDEQKLRRQARQQTLTESANLFGALAALAEAGGARSFQTIKKLRIAEAIVSGIAAVNNVLASIPSFPANVIAAAAIAAQTAANVARIRSTQPGGGGGGAAGGAGLGGGAAGAPGGAPAAVAVEAPAAAGPNITINVEGFVGDQAELAMRITDLIREANGEGGQVEVLA